ncbi:MAG: TetR/AcrR family transcriptional regulator [Caulobacteraceae bacterium]|nr:TetR/AcrR family transcriptional regulator [Caulobacter sp.]
MSLAESAPKTTRGDLRRQAILDIARETFLREGYAAASMSAIGAKAGGSKATLYTYFPSKADLFAAVMADMCGRSRLEITAEAEGAADLPTALRRLGFTYLRILLSDDVITLHRLVVAESQRFPELGQALYEVGPQLGKATMAERLERFIKEGAMRPCEPLRAAGQFFELCLAGLYRRRLWNIAQPITEADMRANVESAVEVFLHGYAA